MSNRTIIAVFTVAILMLDGYSVLNSYLVVSLPHIWRYGIT